jgi:hypothetical protein
MPINLNWTAGGRGALILGRRAYQIAILQPGLGNVDAVFGWLNHAGEARSFGIHWLKIDPILDPLRADSKYRQLLKKVNLVD